MIPRSTLRLCPLPLCAVLLGTPAATAQEPPRPGPLATILAPVHRDVARWGTVIRVTDPQGEPRFTTWQLGDSASRVDFWPASTIKIYTAVAVLEWLNERDLATDSTITFQRAGREEGAWLTDCARTVPEMLSEVFRRSSNEDYTLLLRTVGIDWINTRFLVPERGFPHSALMRDYVTYRPVIYENAEPQRVIVTAPGREARSFEHVWSGTSYAEQRGATVLSSTTGNCTSTAELADCLRRVMFHERLPAEQRFAITAGQAQLLREGDPERGLVGLRNRSGGDFAWTGAGDEVFPEAAYFHKAGQISTYVLDVCYISDSASDNHLILALAAQSGEPRVITDMARAVLVAARDGALPATGD